jgi:hypothetical protein
MYTEGVRLAHPSLGKGAQNQGQNMRKAAASRTNLISVHEEFDYLSLPAARRRELLSEARAIRELVSRSASNGIQIGFRLECAHRLLGCHGYQRWLRAEFGWSESTATRLRQMARVFGNIDCAKQFEPAAMSVLAAHNVPEAARIEAFERARLGEAIAKKQAVEIIRRHRHTPGSLAKRKARRDAARRFIKVLDDLVEDRVLELPLADRRQIGKRLEYWSERVQRDSIVIESVFQLKSDSVPEPDSVNVEN